MDHLQPQRRRGEVKRPQSTCWDHERTHGIPDYDPYFDSLRGFYSSEEGTDQDSEIDCEYYDNVLDLIDD